METYYIVTYTRASGIMRQTVGILTTPDRIDLDATLNKPRDPHWAKFANDPWIVSEIEPVDVP